MLIKLKNWLIRNSDFTIFWTIILILLITSRIYIYNRLGVRFFWEDVILRFLLLFLLLGYINHIYKKYYGVKKYFIFGTACILGLGACVLFKSFHEYYMYDTIFKGRPGNFLGTHMIYNTPVFILYISLGLVFKLRRERLVQMNETRELKIISLDNELNYLKAQINPHFLFNTLNSIFSLIDFSNADARNSVSKFSGLLRYHLYESNTEFIDIEKEISYLKDYMDLQKLRMENNSIAELTVSASASNFKIAPILLLPFVENSFKFVPHNNSADSIIRVFIDKKDGEMIFFCFNSKTELSKKGNGSGIGIANVKRRLELIYPNRHVLEIHDNSDSFIITLKLPVS